MYSRRLLRLAVPLAVGACALSACGSSKKDAVSTPAGGASASASASAKPAAPKNKADGVLTVGTLLPQTGSLAFLGPPEIDSSKLAIKDVNAAGGVLGKPVKEIDSDSGDTSTDIANGSVDRLLASGVDAIVGAASSGVTKTVIDKITGANVVQMSPANTSADFTKYPDNGFYFRTAPSDVLQGRILGDQIIADGVQNVGILALQDAYGTGLAGSLQKSVEGGNGKVVAKVIYDPKAAEFSAEVSKVKAQDPQAIVVVGFDESAKIISELVKQGIGPQQGKKLYLVDGNIGNALGKKLPKGLLKGVSGTAPGADTSKGPFRSRLKALDPKLDDYSYAGESYDAVTLIALAAQQGKADDGKTISQNLKTVSEGGEKCKTYKTCLALVKAGKDIDYEGLSGPVEFDANGDVSQASVGVYTYGADNRLLPKVTFKFGKL